MTLRPFLTPVSSTVVLLLAELLAKAYGKFSLLDLLGAKDGHFGSADYYSADYDYYQYPAQGATQFAYRARWEKSEAGDRNSLISMLIF